MIMVKIQDLKFGHQKQIGHQIIEEEQKEEETQEDMIIQGEKEDQENAVHY